MTRYKVEEAELRSFETQDANTDLVEKWVPQEGFVKYAGRKSTAEGFPFKRVRVKWSEDLAAMVARANYCRILVAEKSNSICFVGKEIDVDVSIQTFLYLAAAAERIAWIEYQTYFDACSAKGAPELARGFRASFLLGFAARLGERYDKHMRSMRETWLRDTKALVVLSSAVAIVNKHIEDKYQKKARVLNDEVMNSAGWLRGRAVAEDIGFDSKQLD